MTDKKSKMDFVDIDSVLSLQLSIYEDYVLESLDFYLNRLKLAQEHCWEAEKHHNAVQYSIHSLSSSNSSTETALTPDQIPVNASEWFVPENTVLPDDRQYLNAGVIRENIQQAMNEGLTQDSAMKLFQSVEQWTNQEYTPYLPDEVKVKSTSAGYHDARPYMAEKIS